MKKKVVAFLLSICVIFSLAGCGNNYDKEQAEATQSKLDLSGCTIQKNEEGLSDLRYNNSYFFFYKNDADSFYYSFCLPMEGTTQYFITIDTNNSITGKILTNTSDGKEETLWYDLVDGKEINESRNLNAHEIENLELLKRLHDVDLKNINISTNDLLNWAEWYYANNQ